LFAGFRDRITPYAGKQALYGRAGQCDGITQITRVDASARNAVGSDQVQVREQADGADAAAELNGVKFAARNRIW
jgi:hypothetical protein